jgi:hypothetical protein
MVYIFALPEALTSGLFGKLVSTYISAGMKSSDYNSVLY